MTRPRFAVIDRRTSAGAGATARSAISEERFHLVEYRNRDLALRGSGENAVAGRGYESHRVFCGVEADARLRDVVEDEQVGALAVELGSRPIDARLPRLGGEADDDMAVATACADR